MFIFLYVEVQVYSHQLHFEAQYITEDLQTLYNVAGWVHNINGTNKTNC